MVEIGFRDQGPSRGPAVYGNLKVDGKRSPTSPIFHCWGVTRGPAWYGIFSTAYPIASLSNEAFLHSSYAPGHIPSDDPSPKILRLIPLCSHVLWNSPHRPGSMSSAEAAAGGCPQQLEGSRILRRDQHLHRQCDGGAERTNHATMD